MQSRRLGESGLGRRIVIQWNATTLSHGWGILAIAWEQPTKNGLNKNYRMTKWNVWLFWTVNNVVQVEVIKLKCHAVAHTVWWSKAIGAILFLRSNWINCKLVGYNLKTIAASSKCRDNTGSFQKKKKDLGLYPQVCTVCVYLSGLLLHFTPLKT